MTITEPEGSQNSHTHQPGFPTVLWPCFPFLKNRPCVHVACHFVYERASSKPQGSCECFVFFHGRVACLFRINKKQEQKENGVGERVVPIDTHFVLRMGLMDNLSLYFKVVKSPECKACLPHHTVALHVYIPHIQILLRDIYTSIMLTNSFFLPLPLQVKCNHFVWCLVHIFFYVSLLDALLVLHCVIVMQETLPLFLFTRMQKKQFHFFV